MIRSALPLIFLFTFSDLTARVRDFPGKTISQTLGADYAYDLKKTRADLSRLLRPGRYRFGTACPLQKAGEKGEILQHDWPIYRATCLDSSLQAFLALTVEVNRELPVWKLLYQIPVGTRITGELELVQSGEVYHTSEWRWRPRKIYFTNPILTALGRRLKDYPLEDVLGERHVSAEIGLIFNTATRLKNPEPALAEVLRSGMEITFSRDCPLEVESLKKSASGSAQLVMRMTCHRGRFARIYVNLDADFLDRFSHVLIAEGARLKASLRYGGSRVSGGQLSLHWSSIINVEAL
ncbi:MAG: hypothetical protein HS115_08490 [Spirochaetales bacterium]|nr:hypothetical protein [Spirochaetales bacterium]